MPFDSDAAVFFCEVVEGKITNLQQELMKIFSIQMTEQELLEIRNLLGNYFAQKVDEEMEKVWKERGYSEETIKGWLNEHMRTPYK